MPLNEEELKNIKDLMLSNSDEDFELAINMLSKKRVRRIYRNKICIDLNSFVSITHLWFDYNLSNNRITRKKVP